ncbi:hypothetical protein SLA2020_237760 [Shorea laevis]
MLSAPPRCNKRKGAQKAKMSLGGPSIVELLSWTMNPMVDIATQSANKYGPQITHFPQLRILCLNGASRSKEACTEKLKMMNPLIFHASHSF